MAKSTGSSIGKVLLTILAVLIVLLLVAEFGLRWFIGNQLREEFAQSAEQQGLTSEEEPSISFGASPVLLGLATGTIREVTINTPDTLQITHPGGADSVPEINGVPESTVYIRGLDSRNTENPVAEHLSVTTHATDEFVLANIQREMAEQTTAAGGDLAGQLISQLVRITGITSNAEANSIEVEFTGGAARATVRPVVTDGSVSFEVLDSQLFGIGMPEEVSGMLTDGLQGSIEEVAGGGLRVTAIEVGDGGIDITLTGDNINVQTLAPAQ